MTTKNEPLRGIQARIEELQNTISEKEGEIKSRAQHLKDDLKAELAPVEMVKKYPLIAAGTTFLATLILTRALTGNRSYASQAKPECSPSPTQSRGALYSIGIDILRSAKDLGFNYLQRYIDSKIK